MALITLKDVTIAFEGVAAVKDASFSVEKGDYLVILGENGSGKSTLVRTILGLVRPVKGQVVYGDRAETRAGRISSAKERRTARFSGVRRGSRAVGTGKSNGQKALAWRAAEKACGGKDAFAGY